MELSSDFFSSLLITFSEMDFFRCCHPVANASTSHGFVVVMDEADILLLLNINVDADSFPPWIAKEISEKELSDRRRWSRAELTGSKSEV